jgi:hypothetical protein
MRKRKTKDVYVLIYNNEEIDETETWKDCKYLLGEYNLAYQGHGRVTCKKKRIKIVEDE